MKHLRVSLRELIVDTVEHSALIELRRVRDLPLKRAVIVLSQQLEKKALTELADQIALRVIRFLKQHDIDYRLAEDRKNLDVRDGF